MKWDNYNNLQFTTWSKPFCPFWESIHPSRLWFDPKHCPVFAHTFFFRCWNSAPAVVSCQLSPPWMVVFIVIWYEFVSIPFFSRCFLVTVSMFGQSHLLTGMIYIYIHTYIYTSTHIFLCTRILPIEHAHSIVGILHVSTATTWRLNPFWEWTATDFRSAGILLLLYWHWYSINWHSKYRKIWKALCYIELISWYPQLSVHRWDIPSPHIGWNMSLLNPVGDRQKPYFVWSNGPFCSGTPLFVLPKSQDLLISPENGIKWLL